MVFRQGRRAQRRFIEPFGGIGHAPAITRKHFHIGQAMMRKAHRLCGLHMGEAGQNRFNVIGRLRQKRALQRGKSGISAGASLAQRRKSVAT